MRLNARKSVLSRAVPLLALILVSPAWGEAVCEDVAGRGYLKILTINIFLDPDNLSDIGARDQRSQDLVDFFIVDNPGLLPDIINVQEVVGGDLVNTDNSAEDLQMFFQDAGVDYNLQTVFEAGIPGVLATANAILSRCEIVFKLFTFLPVEESVEVLGIEVPVTRNVMMVRLNIPGFGKASVYNTHLCASCAKQQREVQVDAMLDFINSVEGFLNRFNPNATPVVLAGDFNIDRFRDDGTGPEEELYQAILEDEFIDGYAESVGIDPALLCENPDPTLSDEHCTVGVSEPIEDPDDAGRRIDYIFPRDSGQVTNADVLFNPGAVSGGIPPAVSNHAAVFAMVHLPLP